MSEDVPNLTISVNDVDEGPEYCRTQDLISSARDGLRHANAQLTSLLEQEVAGIPDVPSSADRLHSTDQSFTSVHRDEISEHPSLLTCKTEEKSEESANPADVLEFDASQLREQLQDLLESTLAGTV